MPFKSKAQQRFMFSQHPRIAKRWADETEAAGKSIKGLPDKVTDSKASETKRQSRKAKRKEMEKKAFMLGYSDGFAKAAKCRKASVKRLRRRRP